MTISVDYIVTCYNKAKYIRHVLESITNQQGDFRKRVIIVDDGSTDTSVKIIQDFQRNSPLPIQLIEQKNSGPALAQNRGLEEITSDYVKLMDGDDILAPYATAHLYDAYINNPGCSISFGAPSEQECYKLDKEGQVILPNSSSISEMKDVEIIHDPLLDSLRSARTTPSAIFTSKKIIDASGGSNPNVFIQDYSFELEAAYLGKFVEISRPVFYTPECIDNRMSGNEAQTLHDVNLAIAYFLERHPDLPAKYRNFALYRCVSRAATWSRRQKCLKLSIKFHFMKLFAKLPFYQPNFGKVESSCEAFSHNSSIRLVKEG